MPRNLGPFQPSGTYPDILQVPGGLASGLINIEGGDGTVTPLMLSEDRVAVDSDADLELLSGGFYLGDQDDDYLKLSWEPDSVSPLSWELRLPPNPAPTDGNTYVLAVEQAFSNITQLGWLQASTLSVDASKVTWDITTYGDGDFTPPNWTGASPSAGQHPQPRLQLTDDCSYFIDVDAPSPSGWEAGYASGSGLPDYPYKVFTVVLPTGAHDGKLIVIRNVPSTLNDRQVLMQVAAVGTGHPYALFENVDRPTGVFLNTTFWPPDSVVRCHFAGDWVVRQLSNLEYW